MPVSTPSDPASAALLAHVLSQTQQNISFLAAQNYITPTDAAELLTRLSQAPSPTPSVDNLTPALNNLSVGPAPTDSVRRNIPPPPPSRASNVQKARAIWAYNEDGRVSPAYPPLLTLPLQLPPFSPCSSFFSLSPRPRRQTGTERPVLLLRRDHRDNRRDKHRLVDGQVQRQAGPIPLQPCREDPLRILSLPSCRLSHVHAPHARRRPDLVLLPAPALRRSREGTRVPRQLRARPSCARASTRPSSPGGPQEEQVRQAWQHHGQLGRRWCRFRCRYVLLAHENSGPPCIGAHMSFIGAAIGGGLVRAIF